LLFSDIKIKTDNQLLLLTNRVLKGTRSGHRVEDWINEIDVNIGSVRSTEVNLDLIMTILTHTHRLYSFRHHQPVKTSQIACLSRVVGRQLRRLLVMIDSSSESCLPLLNRLENVEELALHFHQSYPPVLNQTPGLVLPGVTDFSLVWRATFTLDAARFLFSCDFDKASRAQIVFPTIGNEHIPTLSSFLSDRSQVLEALSIDIPAQAIPLISDVLLRAAKRLSFPTLVPPNNLMDAWSRNSSIRELTVCTGLPGNTLWPLLTSLGTSDERRFDGTEFSLIIKVQGIDVFSWDCGGAQQDNKATFIGNLVYHARQLKKSHIAILDENGEPVLG
jgi:hypothetical protein